MGSVSNPSNSENHFEENGTHSKVNPNLNLIISQSGVEQKVRVKDPNKVEGLIQRILSSGPGELQVITDFDASLCAYSANGKRCSTSYGAISGSRLVPKDVFDQGAKLYNHYHPYENDATISEEERAAKLGEWYERKHENWLKSKMQIPEEDFKKVIKESHLVLREDSQLTLKNLHSHNIPTLVFSAGSGDTIKEVLRLNQVDFPNTKIVANFMQFNEDTRELIGFSQPTIHPGNKNGTVLRGDPYFENLKTRHNAILIGDTTGDVTMASGMPNQNAILKIGFLNMKVEDHLDTFLDTFDVVLIDDQSFHFVNALVDLIIPKTQ